MTPAHPSFTACCRHVKHPQRAQRAQQAQQGRTVYCVSSGRPNPRNSSCIHSGIVVASVMRSRMLSSTALKLFSFECRRCTTLKLAYSAAAPPAAAPPPLTPPAAGSLPAGAPVRLDAGMFPKLLDHLQAGQHKIVCRLTRGADVRTVALVGVDPGANGIVAEYMDSPPGRLVVTQADLQSESLRIEALRVTEVRPDGTAPQPAHGQAQAAGAQ